MGVLGQEPVSGMNRIDVGDLSCTDDPIDLKIAFRALGRTNTHGFVGQLHMQRINVGLGIDGDGSDAEFFAGANDTEGDLAPVSDEDFAKHAT
jgi:hypothetical protein